MQGRVSTIKKAPALKRIFFRPRFRGHEWPLFHRCFALKREANTVSFADGLAMKFNSMLRAESAVTKFTSERIANFH